MSLFNPLSHAMIRQTPRRTSIFSAWNEHLPFAMVLIEMLRPRGLAELGTHAGVSYSAFCQAIEVLGLQCRCFAVDTWQGDDDTGPYGGEVYPEFSKYNERYSAFSTLLRMTFDQALAVVPDGSLDLLHIDGLHSYEAVRHDFETWQPKLSSRAVVLFHDTAISDELFGVKRYWGEVSADRPHFDFAHGSGLGVLGVGTELPPAMADFFTTAQERPQELGALFAGLGGRLQLETEKHAPPAAVAKRMAIYAAKQDAEARARGDSVVRRAGRKFKRNVGIWTGVAKPQF